MHKDPDNDNPMMRAWPSDSAKQARDKWIAAQGGEENARRNMLRPVMPSSDELDEMVASWKKVIEGVPASGWHPALYTERQRMLRRQQRVMLLWATLYGLLIGSAVALIVWFAILGNN